MLVRPLLLIVVMTFMGSVDLEHAEKAELKQMKEYVNGPMGHYSTRFLGIFYIGSDHEFDYVAIKHVAIKHVKNTVKVFKIRRGELGVKQYMKIDANDKKWVDITGMFPLPQ